MKRIVTGVLAAAALAGAGVFDGGQKNVALTVGAGSGFNNNYTIAGVNANYFALNGLSVGLGYRGWFGASPTLNEVEVPVTYYAPIEYKIHPYVGTFYRRTFISGDYEDYDTFGARAGISMVQGNGYISAGWVQEWYSPASGDDNSRGYPEIAAGVSF